MNVGWGILSAILLSEFKLLFDRRLISVFIKYLFIVIWIVRENYYV